MDIDVVVIDSGINAELFSNEEKSICGLHIHKKQNDFYVDSDFQDKYGHGSAVINIIKKHSRSNVLALKIFEDAEHIDEDILIYALNYIKENIKCKVINLSMGIKICNKKKELYDVCQNLCNQGVIIVSAFDNDGCISYPAAFDCVIGVGNSYKCKSATHFEYVEGSPINVLARGGLQRVVWNDRNAVMGGSSFACAYVTAYVATLIEEKNLSHFEVLERIKQDAICVFEKKDTIKPMDDYYKINKAALFPINKEMHALLRHFEDLQFSIEGVYDVKASGRVGANVKQIIASLDREVNCVVKDIAEINFHAIDTLILGHMDEVNRILGQDIRLMLTKKAIDHNVNVFSFDSLDYCIDQIKQRKSKVYYPAITSMDIPQNTFGKLYLIDKPVVSVFGTSSQQGKFTLQLALRDLLIRRKYKVGMLGTEPHSLLFGMDSVFPMGYKSSINVNGHACIVLLNAMLNKICEKNVEIILTGSQANSIPVNTYNVSSFPVKQHMFLLGVQPDAVILCINSHDSVQYINNTIKYIEGAANSEVIALVLFPMSLTTDWRGVFDVKEKLNIDQLKSIRRHFEGFHIPLYVLGEEEDMENLVDLLINYLSDEGEDEE